MDEDLITLSEYKEYHNIRSNTEDSRYQLLISHISSLVESYCNRKFLAYVIDPLVEYYDARLSHVILRNIPVIEIDSVEVSADGGITYETLIENDPDGAGYVFDDVESAIYNQNLGKPFINTRRKLPKSLRVTYTSGFEEIPKDLKLGVYDLVSYYKNNEQVVSKSLMGGSLENPQILTGTSFPPHIRRILDIYRIVT